MPKLPADEIHVPLRIVVASPTPGVLFCVQGEPGELLSPTKATGEDLAFDVVVRATRGDPPRLLGQVVQGPPAARFLYINSGTYAGQTSTQWARRAKVPLGGITRDVIARMKAGKRLTATIPGRMGDGGPVRASVKIVGEGWRWTRRRSSPAPPSA